MTRDIYDSSGHLVIKDAPITISADPWVVRGWREDNGAIVEEVWRDGKMIKRLVNRIEEVK